MERLSVMPDGVAAALAALLLAVTCLAAGVAWTAREERRATIAVVGMLGVAGLAALAAAAASWPSPATVGLVGVLAVVAAVLGGGPLAVTVLRLADRDEPPRGVSVPTAPGTEPPAQHPIEDAAQVLRGGRWIGALERAGVAAAILSGWLPGVAVVLGIKGLGRYPELRHPGAAERFIIGTLVSVLWACAVAGIGVLVRG
jgi:hypothetical protein